MPQDLLVLGSQPGVSQKLLTCHVLRGGKLQTYLKTCPSHNGAFAVRLRLLVHSFCEAWVKAWKKMFHVPTRPLSGWEEGEGERRDSDF